MRRTVLPALLAALLFGFAAPARTADDALSLWRENRRLEAEAVLAATPKPYFELDLERRRVSVKSRGMVLFDVPCRTEKETVDGVEYSTTWAGDQILDIQPRGTQSPLPF